MKKKILLLTFIMCLVGVANIKNLNAQEQTITIGTGTSATEYIPYCERNLSSAGYSVSQQLYSRTDLEGLPENVAIKSISFFLYYSDKNDRNISVYMKNTDKTSNTNTETYTDNDKVFSGVVTTNKNDDMLLTITFTKDFTYTGNGIFIYVNDVTGTKTSLYNKFYYTSKSGGAIYGYSSTGPLTTTDMNRNGNFINNIKITYVESSSSSEPTPPTVTLNTPENDATGIFNPSLNFNVSNADEYKLYMAEGAGTSAGEYTMVKSGTETGNISYQTSNLKSKTTYYWYVVATNNDGTTTTTSDVYTFTTKEFDDPGNITLVSPEEGSPQTANPVVLSWTFGDNTEEYQVWLGTDPESLDTVQNWTNTNNQGTASYQAQNLDANTYYWKVVVRNGMGETPSDVFSFTKIGAPGNVTPIYPANGETGVSINATLTWTFAPNTTHYRVLMDLGSDFEYVDGDADTWLEVTDENGSFSTTTLRESDKLKAGTTYKWAIEVRNNAGERVMYDKNGDKTGDVTEFSFTTTDKTAVKNEAPLDNAIMTTTTAELQWRYGTGNIVDHYMVYLGKDEDKLEAVTGWEDREDRGTVSTSTYMTEPLDNDTRYYWRVDVKYGDDGDVIPGKIGTFVSLLTVPENLTCTANVYPDTPFKISWNATAEATSYNIYVDGMVVANTTETTYSHTMTDANYDMNDGHNIQVTAVYEGLGESQKTAAANVKVTGYGKVKGLVRNVNEENVVGATIILKGADEFGVEQEITVATTDAVGYFEADVLAGTYTVFQIEAELYDTYTSQIGLVLSHKGEKNFETITLTSDHIYNVTLSNQKASSVMIQLSECSSLDIGTSFDVILEKDGVVLDTTYRVYASTFKAQSYALEFSGIWDKPSGSYRIGVRRVGAPDNAISWENYNRNYHVFIKEGDWNEPSNWNNGVVPNNSEVHILKAAHIKAGDVVNTSGNVIIEGTYLESISEKYEGSLKIDGTLKSGDLQMQATFINGEEKAAASVEINGSLVTDKIDNYGSYTNFVLNDGGQFRQIGKSITNSLEGVFNMKIDNPEKWLPQNKTGWQFISSPFQNAKIAKFVLESEDGDYDLYRYDGTRTNEEWLNDKDPNGVTETEFIQGRAYLASYEEAEEVELTGSFYTNNVYNFTQNYTFTHILEGNLENFHLIGNPFTFDMEWTNIQKIGVVEGYAVVNEYGEYEYYNSGTIKVGDGFFVKTISSTVQFKYTDNYTATRSREQGNSINIKLKSKSGNDNVIVSFDGREEGFTKLDNFNDESAVISVVDNDRRYAIVNYDEDVKEVELAFEASKMGVYTIEIA